MKKNNLLLFTAMASLGFTSCSSALTYDNAKKWVSDNYTQTKEITPIKAEITWNFANSSGSFAKELSQQLVGSKLGESDLSGQKVIETDLDKTSVLNANTFEELFPKVKPNPNPEVTEDQNLEKGYTFKLPNNNFYANWSETEEVLTGAAGKAYYFKAAHAQTYKDGLLIENGWKINYGYLDVKDEDGTENILKTKIVINYTYPDKN